MKRLLPIALALILTGCHTSKVTEQHAVIHDTITVQQASSTTIHDTIVVRQEQDVVMHHATLDTAGRVRTITRIVYRSQANVNRATETQHSDTATVQSLSVAETQRSAHETQQSQASTPLYKLVLLILIASVIFITFFSKKYRHAQN